MFSPIHRLFLSTKGNKNIPLSKIAQQKPPPPQQQLPQRPTTSPSAIDWSKEKREKLLITGEDKKVFHLANKIELYNLPVESLPKHLQNLHSRPLTKEAVLEYYKNCLLIRKMELAADSLYKEREIRGFCHLQIGQEAIPSGMKGVLDIEDALITSYRCHGYALMKGAKISEIIGELLGRKIGVSGGKGGSMHMFAPFFYGGNGIVGAQVPLGVGLAFAQKYLKKSNITVAMYGDGAANQGQIQESYNLAKLHNLPIIFVCENNFYSMGTAGERGAASYLYYKRGCDFIPGIRVDGMDTIAVGEVMHWAKDWVLKNGPIIVEFLTYRYSGHSMSDPGTSYREREEIQSVRKHKDTIKMLEEQLISSSYSTLSHLLEIQQDCDNIVKDEVQKALESPPPTEKDLFSNIYYKS